MRCTVLLGCLLTVPGPALDFLGTLPPPCLHYADVVRAIASMRLYTGLRERYPAKQAAHDAPGGGRIILPPDQRRVRTVAGYAAHYAEATAKLATADFFPVDARLRGTHVQGNLKRAVQWSLQRGDQLERHRDVRAQALVRELNRLRECSRTIVEAHMPSHARRIAADANVAGLAALIDALDWPHRELARLAVQGAPVWDPIDGGVYRPIPPKLTPADARRTSQRMLRPCDAK